MKEYIARFHTKKVQADDCTDETALNACLGGLRKDSRFRFSLAKKSAPTYDKLLCRADKYINNDEIDEDIVDEEDQLFDSPKEKKRKNRYELTLSVQNIRHDQAKPKRRN